MPKLLRSPLAQFGVAVVVATAVAAVLLPSSLPTLFSPGLFMPHRHCYLDDPRMLWLQGLSDGLIWLAYMLISAALAYLVYKARHDVPFEWMFLAFGLFIFSCAWTHFMEVITLWYPTYWLSGAIKGITAVASVATAVGLAPLMPRVFGLIETAKASEQRRLELERAHRELAALNQRLRELDQLKSQFFANVSHELRTPLTLILGHTERLRESPNLTEPQQRSLAVLRRNGQVLLKQVNDLLDAAKLEAGRMELSYTEADLAHLVRLSCSNFETLAHDRRIELEVSTPDSLRVEADPEKMERVLFNLLSNAFKFTPAGGHIRCSLRSEDTSTVLEVADTGPGIPREARAAIFERFRQLEGGNTRRFGGTGLGLSIAKDLVEMHGGSIEVGESREGGALFSVRLPQRAPEGTSVQRRPEPAPIPSTPLLPEWVGEPAIQSVTESATPVVGTEPVVLVVEDNREMNELIQDILSPEYRTVQAFNGVEALAKARSTPPDLILTDLMMPEMSGDQLVRQLRADRSLDPVPVVVLTARADDQVRVDLLREGAQDYLLKPFTREELRARAGNLISAKRSRQELARAYGELEAFSYSLAHDMRAPLRTIRSFAQMLSEDYGSRLEGDGTEFVRRIIASGERLDRLITDVLGYTRLQRSPVELHTLALEGFLRGIIQERADFQSPKAEILLRTPLPAVMADEASLTQVVVNLLGNGIKFVPQDTHPRVEIWAERVAGVVRVYFQDNGIGIDPRDQAKLFRLFERVHRGTYEGTGLGLAIVKMAVERMGGRVGVESQPGQGARFWFELRAAG